MTKEHKQLLSRFISREIAKHSHESYYSLHESEINYNMIVMTVELAGYEFSPDDEDYFLKATTAEALNYYLTNIIPKI